VSGVVDRRAAVIQGLIDLANFLETHPDLPITSVDARPYIHGTDDEERAEVDRIAAILGQPAGYTSGARTHYEVERDFGGRVHYRATAITAAHMAEYSAHTAAAPWRAATDPQS
jgi:hypothetical protein